MNPVLERNSGLIFAAGGSCSCQPLGGGLYLRRSQGGSRGVRREERGGGGGSRPISFLRVPPLVQRGEGGGKKDGHAHTHADLIQFISYYLKNIFPTLLALGETMTPAG